MCFYFNVVYIVSVVMLYFFFFFKQKTAYEMRISDWSSDVCSSDLEAERAGARVAMRTAAQCSDQQKRTLSRDIQRDEARWCGVLTHAIHRLHGTPSRATGAFHDKAMAIENIAARLAFLNRGQWWVVKRLQEFLPKIGDETRRAELRERTRGGSGKRVAGRVRFGG